MGCDGFAFGSWEIVMDEVRLLGGSWENNNDVGREYVAKGLCLLSGIDLYVEIHR